MIHLIHTSDPEHIGFGDNLHPRTRHIQDQALAVVGYRRERGIDPGHRNRPRRPVPRLEGIDAGEGKQSASPILGDHRDNRHSTGLVGEETINFLDFIRDSHHGHQHTTHLKRFDERCRIGGIPDRHIRRSVVRSETRGGRQGSTVAPRMRLPLPLRHRMSLSGTIADVRPTRSSTRSTAAILSVVVLVAVNLRLALSSLPAVATAIQADTGWNDALIGALTTVPVLAMGLFALGVPALAERIGRRGAVAAALATMIVAMLMRGLGAIALTLFISALLAGLSIAILGGLVPGIVREQLSGSMGSATALWTTAMMGGAALGAAATLPLAELLGGWNRALALWALPAVFGLIAWIALERGGPAHDRPPSLVRLRDLPWRNATAWALTGLMTLNSIVFYSALAWIAPSYQERGYSAETAGIFFGIFTAGQMVGALLLPRWSHRSAHRRTLFSATLIMCAGAITLIAFAPTFAPPIVLTIFAFSLSGGFAMALGLLSEYAHDAAGSARLTAMAFSITYSVAAFGPFIAGALMDAIDSWELVYILMAIVTLAQFLTVPLLKKNVTIA